MKNNTIPGIAACAFALAACQLTATADLSADFVDEFAAAGTPKILARVKTGEPDSNASVHRKARGSKTIFTFTIPRGDRGFSGPAGADGAVGAKGAAGAPGAVGAKGATGAVGAKGGDGTPGSVGAKGEKGDKGDKGDQGLEGLRGPEGPAGPSNITSFIWQATIVYGGSTYINDPKCNGAPNAILMVTATSWGVSNPHPIEVGYASDEGQWIISNSDNAPMTANARFNVLVFKP